ncbi:MAG: exodeoxyribonuclease VII small subunit [Erysipelotrichia bacterium]|nr:exodeoxyribonuclease VII small subunit [Erysipelotrichia bacterium]
MENSYNFEKEMQRLDEIVSAISSETLPLDTCLKLYQEGQKIVKRLEKALKEAEEKVEKVISTTE